MHRATAIAAVLIAGIAVAGCDSRSDPTTTVQAVKAPLDTSHAKKTSTRVQQGQTFNGLLMSTSLPYTIQLGKNGALKVHDEGHANIIYDGDATLALDARGTVVEPALRVKNFDTTTDTCLVQVDVGLGSDTSLVGVQAADGKAPELIDTQKGRYVPIGYLYEDESKLRVRFTPGDVIQKFEDLPSLSRSRPAQKLTLLYRVSAGRSVKYFALDNAAVVEFHPPVAVTQSTR